MNFLHTLRYIVITSLLVPTLTCSAGAVAETLPLTAVHPRFLPCPSSLRKRLRLSKNLLNYCKNHSITPHTIQEYLSHGADINIMDPNGSTPLREAVYKGNVPVIRLLLKNGARVNPYTGPYSLLACCSDGETAGLLLHAGCADPRGSVPHVGSILYTELEFAILLNHDCEKIKHLVDREALYEVLHGYSANLSRLNRFILLASDGVLNYKDYKQAKNLLNTIAILEDHSVNLIPAVIDAKQLLESLIPTHRIDDEKVASLTPSSSHTESKEHKV